MSDVSDSGEVSHTPKSQTVSFADFELDAEGFSLRQQGEPVSLEPQVLSLLAYLIEHRNRLVSKNELLDELWGHRFVSESALATQIKRLRRVLGDDGRTQGVIKTVHGRGYRFVAAVHEAQAQTQATPRRTAAGGEESGRLTNLGYERTPLYGRDAELKRCIESFQDYRMVSLLGIAGTGKTRLAKAIGRQVRERYPDGVWFVDLVPVRSGAGIDTAIAAVMGVTMSSGGSREQLADALRDRRVLLILDNCEHIEDQVAAALDHFLEHTSQPHFLATSRDPIDLADELRFFLDPLEVRNPDGDSPAAQLFKATARRHGVSEQQLEKPVVDQVCERLDGLPLAIELAAAQLKHLTLDELVSRLDRRFDLLAGRQREGSDRQESLAAVIEDTWRLLNEEEQQLLGQLAVFPGQFTMSDIEEVFDTELAHGISFAMSRLVELCLLSRTSRKGAWWRLLETVRLFALSKLSPDARTANAGRHARWCLARLGTHPGDQLHSYAHAQWAADHYADITAAELHFHEQGDLDNAVDVCTAVGLMIQLDEGARALAKLQRITLYLDATDDLLAQVKLHGMAALCGQVTRNPELLAHHAEVSLELARSLNQPARLTGALILSSLTNNFTNPALANARLEEAIEVAATTDNAGTINLAGSYQAWYYAMQGRYEKAVTVGKAIAERNLGRDQDLDNPTYSAICSVIAGACLREPEVANHWVDTIEQYPQAHTLWGGTLLFACARAAAGQCAAAAEMCVTAHERLTRVGSNAWPDLFVPLAVLALQRENAALAQAYLNNVKQSPRPLQTFHIIAVYRQLRERLLATAEPIVDEGSGRHSHDHAIQWLHELRELDQSDQ